MFINRITLSGQTLAANTLTPLNRALQQLVNSNTAVGVQLSTCKNSDKERLCQRFAYLALVFSTGKGNQATWFSNVDECLWMGVACNNKKIISLELGASTLQGFLPADIGLWTNLAKFDVNENKLGGPLPSSIGKWSSLTYFSVADNEMIGNVPVAVANWTSIEIAYFDLNAFSGTMPIIGNNFCPRLVLGGDMAADCAPPAEIICDCCLFCCDNSGTCWAL
jgi:hypothetical protein